MKHSISQPTTKLKLFGRTCFITVLMALSTSVAYAQEVAGAASSALPVSSIASDAAATNSLTEAAVNPYGLAALWAQGDWVAKATLIILLIMSMISWYVVITRLLAHKRLMNFSKETQLANSNSQSIRASISRLKQDNPFRYIAIAAMEAEHRHPNLNGQVDLNQWLAQHIENASYTVIARQQSGLAELATIGSTAPFVGLFGTVWGIYNALIQIGASGQASLDKVAGPVGEALIMTAIGLAVAVPAVLCYNWLVRRNRQNADLIKNYASGLHSEMLATTSRKASN